MIIDVKEYVVFMASCSQLQTVRGEFEAFCASLSAKRTDKVVIMSIVSSARKFEWLHIFWNVSYICFSYYNFFSNHRLCFCIENLLFWRGFNHLASISELI